MSWEFVGQLVVLSGWAALLVAMVAGVLRAPHSAKDKEKL